MRNLIHLLLLISLFLGGCRPLASLVVNSASSISLKPCALANGEINAECGNMRVPEDRANPNGRILDLGIVVVRARDPRPELDPLFFVAGGPGGIATDLANVSDARTLFKDVNARRDIVYLDQRGTSDKHLLTCDPMPDAVEQGTQREMDVWMKKCLSSLDGDPRFYTTAEAMRDLDTARAALGYDKINLYGGSYGATAVQVYLRLFPEHVRAAVLDHGTALDVPFLQVLPNASQFALDHVFTLCEQDERCHGAYPDIRGDWKAILARLARGPVTTSLTIPGTRQVIQVDMDMLVKSVHSTLFKSGGYIKVPFFTHMLATHEDWTPILKENYEQQGNPSQPERFLLMANMIFCFEPAWGSSQPEEVARVSSGSYMRDQEVRDAKIQQKICAALPKPAPSLIYGPGNPAPLNVLMLNSLIDPQNPPPNMTPALKEFTRSRLVVESTEGHEASSSECRWGIITQFLQKGSMDGLDIACIEHQKPSFVAVD